MSIIDRVELDKTETPESCTNMDFIDKLPEVRDGLNRKERIILYCLDQLQKERGGRHVQAIMLYGRVIEHIDMSMGEFQATISIVGDRVK